MNSSWRCQDANDHSVIGSHWCSLHVPFIQLIATLYAHCCWSIPVILALILLVCFSFFGSNLLASQIVAAIHDLISSGDYHGHIRGWVCYQIFMMEFLSDGRSSLRSSRCKCRVKICVEEMIRSWRVLLCLWLCTWHLIYR